MNLLNKIKLWWKFDGKYYHKDFAHGVRNLWRWFPTIWRDRDWDGDFIYEILRVKLENQAVYIGSRDIHVDAKRDSERMLLCARLIQIQKEDLYAMEYMEYHETEYDFIPTDETKKWYAMEDTLISENLDEYFAKYPRQYKRVLSGKVNRLNRNIDDTADKKLIAMEIAHENQERSRKLLFKILEDHIEEWWD